MVGAAAAPELRLRGSVRLLLLAGAGVAHSDEDALCIIPALYILQVVTLPWVACRSDGVACSTRCYVVVKCFMQVHQTRGRESCNSVCSSSSVFCTLLLSFGRLMLLSITPILQTKRWMPSCCITWEGAPVCILHVAVDLGKVVELLNGCICSACCYSGNPPSPNTPCFKQSTVFLAAVLATRGGAHVCILHVAVDLGKAHAALHHTYDSSRTLAARLLPHLERSAHKCPARCC